MHYKKSKLRIEVTQLRINNTDLKRKQCLKLSREEWESITSTSSEFYDAPVFQSIFQKEILKKWLKFLISVGSVSFVIYLMLNIFRSHDIPSCCLVILIKFKLDNFNLQINRIVRQDALTENFVSFTERGTGLSIATITRLLRDDNTLNATAVSLIRRRLRPVIISARVHHASTRGRKRNSIARATKLNRNFRPLSDADGETKQGLIVGGKTGGIV